MYKQATHFSCSVGRWTMFLHSTEREWSRGISRVIGWLLKRFQRNLSTPSKGHDKSCCNLLHLNSQNHWHRHTENTSPVFRLLLICFEKQTHTYAILKQGKLLQTYKKATKCCFFLFSFPLSYSECIIYCEWYILLAIVRINWLNWMKV